jgi:RNA polymerase sigma-70 factor (ECF subfamily)
VNTFKDFYSRQRQKFFSYLVRRSGDYHLAADIMQESFTRLYEKYSEENFTPQLLYTIGRNLAHDELRRRNRNPSLSEQKDQPTIDPSHDLVVRDEYRRVMVAMRHLENDERDLLSLAVSCDLSYRELAEMTGISVANVKVKIHRARKKLRSFLETGGT